MVLSNINFKESEIRDCFNFYDQSKSGYINR